MYVNTPMWIVYPCCASPAFISNGCISALMFRGVNSYVLALHCTANDVTYVCKLVMTTVQQNHLMQKNQHCFYCEGQINKRSVDGCFSF